MRTVLLIRSLGVGGAERQIELLAKGLVARGHEVTLLLFYDGGERAARLASEGIKVHSLGKRGRWEIVGFLIRLLREIKAARPDALYSFLTVSNILAGAMKPLTGCRTIWGVRASGLDLQSYNWLVGVTAWTEARMSRFADLIISNSQAGKRYAVANGFPEGKTIVISNGIDTHQFRPDPDARRRFREEQHLDDNMTVVGLVGRMDPMKGHATFLQAIHLLASRQPDLVFLCVGGGDNVYRNRLKADAAAMGIQDKVLWLPPSPDMATVYNGLDLLCSASIFGEGFPNVIGEAMSCGLVSVATDVGDSARIIDNRALIARASDPEGLAAVIEAGLKIRKSGAAARSRIEDNFSLENMIARTEAALAMDNRVCQTGWCR